MTTKKTQPQHATAQPPVQVAFTLEGPLADAWRALEPATIGKKPATASDVARLVFVDFLKANSPALR